MTKISFIKSDDRIYNIDRCLSLIKSEITAILKDAKMVVVKPEVPRDDCKEASTHTEALAALLEFIRPHTKGQIRLAASTTGDTLKAFKDFGYLKLQDLYDLEIVDLNSDSIEKIELKDTSKETVYANFPKTLVESDCVISIVPPKTDGHLVYNGCISNVTINNLRKQSKNGIFGNTLGKVFGLNRANQSVLGKKIIHQNIADIYKRINLKLAVIDGFETMEGEGPVNGNLVQTRFAIAGTNPIATDWLACQISGIKTDDVGYLPLLGASDVNNYFIIGDDWKKSLRPIKMHPEFDKIRQWQ